MKEKMGSLPVTAAALVCALLGLSLRAAGRSGGAGALIAVSACVTLAAAVYALLAQKERDYACVFEKSLFDAAASCLGALLIGVGCALEALNGAGTGRYIAVLGALSALALIRAAALRWSGRKPGAGWFAPMIVYYLAKLFFDYRQWMLDPAILDYCFMLFAMLLFLLASYYAAVFSFDRGGRLFRSRLDSRRRPCAHAAVCGQHSLPAGVSLAGGNGQDARAGGACAAGCTGRKVRQQI